MKAARHYVAHMRLQASVAAVPFLMSTRLANVPCA